MKFRTKRLRRISGKRKIILLPFLFTSCQSFISSPIPIISGGAIRIRSLNFPPVSETHYRRSRAIGIDKKTVLPLRVPLLPAGRTLILNSLSCKTSNDNNEDWKAGDWKSDLQALESAVALSNAPTDLAQKERLDLLDEFSRQRRDLIPDILWFVMRPCTMASTLVFASKSASSRIFVNLLVHAMNVCFWSMSVFIPLLLHIKVKQRKMGKRRKSEWEAEYINPEEDSSDYSRCLLENWAFSIYPSALLGCITLLSHIIIHTSRRTNLGLFLGGQSLLSWRVATAFSQLITRLGVAASIHQFPIYLYHLRKEHTKGPVPLFQSVLRTLVHASLWILPLGFATDVSQLYVYGRVMEIGGLKHALSMASFRGGRIVTILSYSILASSIMMQLCQFMALKKLIRVGYFTKISLATSPRKLQALLRDPDADPDAFQMKLRYRLHWREPARLFKSFRVVARDFSLFLFTGWGDDASILEESDREPHLLKLIQKEMDENTHPNPLKLNREEWIPDATKRMSEIHQENYDKNTFEDPLGIALQQTFGIGLSFDFDHNSKLGEGQSPSVHRLRARAVKSAIKRYHEIPDDYGGDADADANEEMQIRIAKERAKLKKTVMRLLSLIPSNAPAPEGKPLDVLSMRQSEVASLSGVANLPFLRDDDDDDDPPEQLVDGRHVVVKDPYLDDDIFSSDGEHNVLA
jgi:hypothetical protein